MSIWNFRVQQPKDIQKSVIIVQTGCNTKLKPIQSFQNNWFQNVFFFWNLFFFFGILFRRAKYPILLVQKLLRIGQWNTLHTYAMRALAAELLRNCQ